MLIIYLQHALVALAIQCLHLEPTTISSLDYGYPIYHLTELNLKNCTLLRKKLPNKRSDIVKKITNFYLNGRSFTHRAEKLLQKIFSLVAVKPSFELNLIQQENPYD